MGAAALPVGELLAVIARAILLLADPDREAGQGVHNLPSHQLALQSTTLILQSRIACEQSASDGRPMLHRLGKQ